jgi:hypothetical protein
MSEWKPDVLIRCDAEPAKNMADLCTYMRGQIGDKVCWIICYANDGEPAVRVDYEQVPVRLPTDIYYTLYNCGKAAGGSRGATRVTETLTPRLDGDSAPALRTPAQRRRATDRAEKELERLGI